MKSVTFIVNPLSGTHKKGEIPDIISQALDKTKFDYKVLFTEYAGHAAELTRNAVKGHTDIVVAVGGDGTVNEVARSLVHTSTCCTVRELLRTPIMMVRTSPRLGLPTMLTLLAGLLGSYSE